MPEGIPQGRHGQHSLILRFTRLIPSGWGGVFVWPDFWQDLRARGPDIPTQDCAGHALRKHSPEQHMAPNNPFSGGKVRPRG